MRNHLHISAMNAFVVWLMFLVTAGTARLLALRFADHPLAQAYLQIG